MRATELGVATVRGVRVQTTGHPARRSNASTGTSVTLLERSSTWLYKQLAREVAQEADLALHQPHVDLVSSAAPTTGPRDPYAVHGQGAQRAPCP